MSKQRLGVFSASILACLAVTTATARPAGAETLRAEDVVKEAIAHSPTLKAATSDLAAAHSATEAESARYDPTLTVSAGLTHTKNPSLSPGSSTTQVGTNDVAQADATITKTLPWGTQLSANVESTATKSATPYVVGAQGSTTPVVLTVGPGYLFSAKVGVTQPLLRGAGRDVVFAPYYQAVAQESASGKERGREASALARDVLTAYWELWYASKAVEVDRRARDTAKAQRDDADKRMQTGSLARADVLTFETQLSTKEETLMQTELDRETRQNELARLLGRDRAASDMQVAEGEPPEPGDISGELVARAVANSPEIATKEASVSLAEVQERTAADAYRPRLDLDAYVQAQGLGNDDVPAAFTQLAGFGVLSAHVGLTLELPLTDKRRQAEADRARAQTDVARNNLDAAKKEVATNVTSQVQKRDLARRRITLAVSSATFAQDQLTAQQALFASGSGTALQVIQAQDNVQNANKRLARARADLVQAHLSLSHLVGALSTEANSR